jgi:hypothetical protein
MESRRRLGQRLDSRQLLDRTEVRPRSGLRLWFRLWSRVDDGFKRWGVLDGLLKRLVRRRRSLLFGLRPLLLALSSLGRPKELRERALTHAGALSRH